MPALPPEFKATLARAGQSHLISHWEQLPEAEQTRALQEWTRIDWIELQELFAQKDHPPEQLPPRAAVSGLPTLHPREFTADDYATGEQALAAGQVAVLLVAGGQGSRLGFPKPKGLFPIGPVTGKSLFQYHAEKVLAICRRVGQRLPFLVMTSTATHEETVAFFEEHQFFGLERDQVHFFQQGVMPALDAQSGQVLLESPGRLFLSPNGHGGSLIALADSGWLARLRAAGITQLFYFQVDNPLVQIAEPGFLGRHIRTECEASSKVVFKSRPEEKVGLLAVIQGRCGIIEYSDLPESWAHERTPTGELLFRAGNPAIHWFSLAFLERVTQGRERLKFHRARKKVPYYDPVSGAMVEPQTANALKFELFIFDALPLADRWLAVEASRDDEFAPVKNASGVDSPETARAALMAYDAKQLAKFVAWPQNSDGDWRYPLEISPLWRGPAPGETIPTDGPLYLS